MESTKILLAIVLFGLFFGALGHSYVTEPITRSNQKQSNAGCRGPSCMGPCDAPLSSKKVTIQASRGQSITVKWPRNNHAGGFIRFAWAPTSQSDSHAAFDNNVQQINCHEVGGCRPDDLSNPNGGDSGAGDGSFQPCQSTISVPSHLTDGEWTLQWAWFGGAFSLGDYFSCVDYRISGGALSVATTPVFIGGDFTYPNQQKCKFFNTNQLHKCTSEPCNNPIFPASQEQSGVPAFIQSVSAPTPSAQVPSTPVSTTGRSQPMSTGRVMPSSTGRVTPSSTGLSRPSSTGPASSQQTSTTRSAASQPPASSSLQTCAGVASSSVSRAVVASIDTWNNGQSFRAVVLLWAQEAVLNNWLIDVQWPQGSNVQVTGAWNSGTLACQGSGRATIRPSASWANNIISGGVQTIEIVGTSTTPMDSNYLSSNTIFRVLKQD